MEYSLINKANAIKATQFLLDLDASAINEPYQHLAKDWVKNILTAKCAIEKTHFINTHHPSDSVDIIWDALVNNAKGLANMLTPEAQEKLTQYLLIQQTVQQ